MSVKNKVLKLLEENRGSFLSGEKMADSLKVSRTAIWKAMRSLQNEGYSIDAVTNKGYMLHEDSNMLSKEGIELYLKSGAPLHFFHSTDSTNKRAAALALEGACSGTCVIAEHQSAGRGRLGRSFYSPERQGIYLSVILKPDFDISKAVLITAAASVAVKRAIQTVCGACPQIKWVNDLYLDGKKICGILTEAITDFESGQITNIVVGIGINCSCEDFPDEIQEIAGGIPGSYSKNALAAEVVNQLLDIASLTNQTFTSFVSGQLTEAVIIGILCFLGMLILRLPYAGAISTFVAFTALIPVFGAWLGGGLGAFLILLADPIKAVWFIIYLLLLQQVEGNLIYPKVVGKSVGLPGLLVLMAVTVGGEAFGILGMLFSVPVCAVLYNLYLAFMKNQTPRKG